jgi:hypothetical protein
LDKHGGVTQTIVSERLKTYSESVIYRYVGNIWFGEIGFPGRLHSCLKDITLHMYLQGGQQQVWNHHTFRASGGAEACFPNQT